MRNGSGTYIPPVNSWSPAVNGNSATPSDFNALLADIASAISQSVASDGQTPVTANLPMGNNKITGLSQGTGSGDAVSWEQLFSLGAEVDVASAATTDIGAVNSTLIRITGTTTITSFGTTYRGPRLVRFGGALQLTHNATTLILPGAANITTAAGDCAIVRPIGSPGSGWVVMHYQRAASLINGAASLGANTFTGAQTLHGNAVNALEAVPKQQLDEAVSTKANLTGSSSQQFSVASASLAAHAVRLSQFDSSLNSNGYQKLPSGLIIQWGTTVGYQPPSGVGATFPIQFPNQCFHVSGSWSGGPAAALMSISFNTNSWSGYVDEWANTNNFGQVFWIAIGV